MGVALTAAIALALTGAGVSPAAGLRFTPESLNGAGNNRAHPSAGVPSASLPRNVFFAPLPRR